MPRGQAPQYACWQCKCRQRNPTGRHTHAIMHPCSQLDRTRLGILYWGTRSLVAGSVSRLAIRGRAAQGCRRCRHRCRHRCRTWLPQLLLALLLYCVRCGSSCQLRLAARLHCCCACAGSCRHAPASCRRRPSRQRVAAAVAACCWPGGHVPATGRCCACSCAMRAARSGQQGLRGWVGQVGCPGGLAAELPANSMHCTAMQAR